MTALAPIDENLPEERQENVGDPRTLRILVAVGSPVLCEAVTARLSEEEGFRPIPAAGSAKAVERLSEELRPDVVVVDAAMLADAQFHLIEVLRSLAKPPAVIAIIGEEKTRLVSHFIAKGVQAAVLTTAPSEELTIAIRWSVQGAGWISPPILRDVLDDLRQRLGTPTHPVLLNLTKREREVLQLMVDGLGRREMATRLCVSLDTIRTHVRTILDKLDVHSATDAVAAAREAGLRPTGDLAH